jgi:hypothetical protein
MDAILERSRQLQQALTQFVLDADGDLAASLELYAVSNSRPNNTRLDAAYEQKLLVDSFVTEGLVGDHTPLDLFLDTNSELQESDRALIRSWRKSFIGLFAVVSVLPDGFELVNWLTNKHYIVKPNEPQTLAEMMRFQQGDILQTRIAPVTNTYWTFSGPYLTMGRLGKPKLAVAIGNFKENHKDALYSDAPKLLEQAWESVTEYHKEFLEFFGNDQVTLPGYQLNKKINELQELITQRRLAAIGIDQSKSLADIAEEAGVTEAEMKAAAEEAGADADAVSQLFDNSEGKTKMVMPKVELPAEFNKAEQVTVFTHPRWGQLFLPTYTQFTAILESEDSQSHKDTNKLVKKYLEDSTINAFIWQKLAQAYPTQLEKVLQNFLERKEFKLASDLDTLLQKYNKPLEPELPQIASVPIHLHNLFQEALAEVNKSKSKGKKKENTAKGFK